MANPAFDAFVEKRITGPTERASPQIIDVLLRDPLTLRLHLEELRRLSAEVGSRYVLVGEIAVVEALAVWNYTQVFRLSFFWLYLPSYIYKGEQHPHVAITLRIVDLQSGVVVADAVRIEHRKCDGVYLSDPKKSEVSILITRVFRNPRTRR